jgi:hypothetical protein
MAEGNKGKKESERDIVKGKVGEPNERGYVDVKFDGRYVFEVRGKRESKRYSIEGIKASKAWLKIYMNGDNTAEIPEKDLRWYIAREASVPQGAVQRYFSKTGIPDLSRGDDSVDKLERLAGSTSGSDVDIELGDNDFFEEGDGSLGDGDFFNEFIGDEIDPLAELNEKEKGKK